YKMVFVPFTAIDNHRRSVTVGSGLLKRETAEAYGWLLRAFKKAFIRALNIIVTDQDGVMRLDVAAEFPESEHRLFIIYDETDFKEKFGKIVWNMFIGPEEFEDKWNKLMEEFNLVNHKWLSKMYRLRSSWIPAFFVDSPLCGLMRTTSRSESENSFFSYFLSSGATLKKIVAGSWLCSITGMSSDEGCTVCTIDKDKVKRVGFPKVIDKENTYENVDEEINLHKKHTGYYKVKSGREISMKKSNKKKSGCGICGSTSHNRRTCLGKDNPDALYPAVLVSGGNDHADGGSRDGSSRSGSKLSMEASIILDFMCVHDVEDNEPKLSVFVSQMKEIKSKLEAELPIVPNRTVSDFVEEFMGVKKPNQVKVRNPTGVKPKGREKGKRIKSGREISMKKSNKKKSGCGICGSTSLKLGVLVLGKDNPVALYLAYLFLVAMILQMVDPYGSISPYAFPKFSEKDMVSLMVSCRELGNPNLSKAHLSYNGFPFERQRFCGKV
ncbi:FAR1-related sequence 5-like protein, partial [Tanacetum coccineum]